MKQDKFKKSIRTSVWLAYILIVFEILYMISPFAFLYYSVYAVPLRFLQSSPLSSWLTTNILPHFTYQNSIFISILNFMSWPLIVIGLILFLVGFIQIYWVKLRGKGSVSNGLYKYIRHPQYVALAITGLGAAIYWSRFIVFLMYATMLFLYYYLAKQEERICAHKFGQSYRTYAQKTGMFFPKSFEDRLPKIPALLPEIGIKRIAVITIIFCLYITAMTGIGFLMKDYALSKTNVFFSESQALISVAPLSKDQIEKTMSVIASTSKSAEALDRLDLNKSLIYILPSEWGIPELGIRKTGNNKNYLLHPETHGNSLEFDDNLLTVLVAEPILSSSSIRGKKMLKRALSFIPHMEISINLEREEVTEIKKRSNRGQWDGIPVPIY